MESKTNRVVGQIVTESARPQRDVVSMNFEIWVPRAYCLLDFESARAAGITVIPRREWNDTKYLLDAFVRDSSEEHAVAPRLENWSGE
jgi:hypothetical protein